ncbi:MAG TPA: hypothetical protein VIN11_05605, partial [Roseivirga sp.]
VLPVPVWADAITSLRFKICGMAFSCITDGVVYPFLLTACSRDLDNPRDSNDINNFKILRLTHR